MSAKEMFEKLGYELFLDDETTIIYRRKNDYEDNMAVFYKDRKSYSIQFIDWLDNKSDNWIPMSERKEQLKHCSTYGKWQLVEYPINIDLHKAINKQVEELGLNK